jgi:Tol biopolymer transport system component
MGKQCRRWLVVVAAAAAALALAPAAAGDRILFINTRDGNSEVWAMNEDGSGQTAITDRAPVGSTPAWSPDGSRIAFTGGLGNTARPWIMTLDGSVLRPLGFGSCFPHDCNPDWSPSGRRLVISSRRDIYVVQRDGARPRRLTRGGLNVDPAWSPTGRWIVFKSKQGLTLIRPDGTDRRVIGPGREPDWSPSGDRIVFVYRVPGRQRDIYTMRLDGSDRRRLTRTPFLDEGNPAWSPNGRKIAFSRDGALWVMNANGTGARRVVGDWVVGASQYPAWAPSGRRLVFSRFYDTGDDPMVLFTIRVNGSGLRRVLTPESDVAVAASPDGSRLAYSSVRRFSQTGIYVADADGANETFVHAGFEASFSADGSRLLVEISEESSPVVVDLDGTNPTLVPFPSGEGIEVAWDWQWHPDGRVSFVGQTDDFCSDVYTMDLDGTDVTRVTPASCPGVGGFGWNPSGSMLVFSASTCVDCLDRLYAQSVPGGSPSPLTGTPDANDFGVSISPDGATVLFSRAIEPMWWRTTIWAIDLDGTDEVQLTLGGAEGAPAWLPDPP